MVDNGDRKGTGSRLSLRVSRGAGDHGGPDGKEGSARGDTNQTCDGIATAAGSVSLRVADHDLTFELRLTGLNDYVLRTAD